SSATRHRPPEPTRRNSMPVSRSTGCGNHDAEKGRRPRIGRNLYVSRRMSPLVSGQLRQALPEGQSARDMASPIFIASADSPHSRELPERHDEVPVMEITLKLYSLRKNTLNANFLGLIGHSLQSILHMTAQQG